MSRLAMGRAAAHRLGSGGTQLLLRGSSARLATRLPSRLTAAGLRLTRDASEWKPTRFPPPSPDPHSYPGPNYGVPPPQPPPPPPGGGGPRYGKLAFLLSAVAVGAAYFAGSRGWSFDLPTSIFAKSDARSDVVHGQLWSPGMEALQHIEKKSDEPYRTLYREAHEAIAKKDWPEVERTLAAAWKATEGAEDSRFVAFDPILVRLLLQVYLDKQDGGESLLSFVQEALPAMDHARALPSRPEKAHGPSWDGLFANSLGVRALVAGFIAKQHIQPTGSGTPESTPQLVAERVAPFLEPAREDVTTMMEKVRVELAHSFDEVDAYNVAIYCNWIYRIAMINDRHLDAIRFTRYRLLVVSSKDDMCDGMFNLGYSILGHLGEVQSSRQEAGKIPVLAGDSRSEFQDPEKVLTMPMEKFSNASAEELLQASEGTAQLGLYVLPQTSATGTDRDILECKILSLATKVCLIMGDQEKARMYIEKLEKIAKRHARRTKQTDMLELVQDLKNASESGLGRSMIVSTIEKSR